MSLIYPAGAGTAALGVVGLCKEAPIDDAWKWLLNDLQICSSTARARDSM